MLQQNKRLNGVKFKVCK